MKFEKRCLPGLLHFMFVCFTPLCSFSIAIPLNQSVFQDEYKALIPRRENEICMRELGCFGITDDYKKRPLNVLPNDRVIIDTKHLLFTKRNPKEPHLLVAHDKESFTSSEFDAKSPTKFIVHGYLDSEVFGPWMVRMKDEFLLQSDYNIIIVDWSGGNKGRYTQATANTRVVGAEIALMITALKKHFGLQPEDCHILGHSLGSHIAGYAGERLNKLGRITGLDPAGPLFEGMPPSVRLDRTDALYVDVIHTNAGLLGIQQLVGHVDFFPNGGAVQPGCRSIKSHVKILLKDGINELFRSVTSCHHQRVTELVRYSINYKKVVPTAYQCSSYEAFLAGKCAECGTDMTKCAIMGIRADEYRPQNDSVQQAFYLKTGASDSYWLYHYRVVVKLYKPKVKHDDPKINMEINLHGSKEDYLSKVFKGQQVYHGSQYQFLITTDKDLGKIKAVTIKYDKSSLLIFKIFSKPKLYVDYITVVLMNVVEKTPRDMTGRVFCGKRDRPLEPKTVTYFQGNDDCKTRLT